MKLRHASIVAILVLVAGQSVFAQCTRSGSQLIVDGSFANNCSNWVWLGATRMAGTLSCVSAAAKFQYQEDEVDQSTIADAGGANFALSYTFLASGFINDSGGIDVVIHDVENDIYTQVDTISTTTGQNFCTTRNVPLGSHSAWTNHHLTLIFIAGFSGITRTGKFYVDNVSLTQTN